MMPSKTVIQFTIDEVEKKNEGRYICTAINDEGFHFLLVNLIAGSVPEPLRVAAISKITL